MSTPIKAGDLVYAVGPGHHAPHGPTERRVYSAVVKSVRESAPPELHGSVAIEIELNDDRPLLGFPRGIYNGRAVGRDIHHTAVAALSAFAKQAEQRRETAEREREYADHEVAWARKQACAIANEGDLIMPEGLDDAGRRAYEIIVAYFKEHELTTAGAQTFFSPVKWKDLQEAYGTESHLIVVYSGSMRAAFSMDAAYALDCEHYQQTGKSREPYALYEGMQEKLRAAGLYFEECTTWYSAVYSTGKP